MSQYIEIIAYNQETATRFDLACFSRSNEFYQVLYQYVPAYIPMEKLGKEVFEDAIKRIEKKIAVVEDYNRDFEQKISDAHFTCVSLETADYFLEKIEAYRNEIKQNKELIKDYNYTIFRLESILDFMELNPTVEIWGGIEATFDPSISE